MVKPIIKTETRRRKMVNKNQRRKNRNKLKEKKRLEDLLGIDSSYHRMTYEEMNELRLQDYDLCGYIREPYISAKDNKIVGLCPLTKGICIYNPLVYKPYVDGGLNKCPVYNNFFFPKLKEYKKNER